MSVTPYASLVLPAFNQERYIEESVGSVLSQNCPPSEILISDDSSSDRTFDIIERIISQYKGPHVVRAMSNKRNLGSGNLISLAKAASSRYVVVFHGDDISDGERVTTLVEALKVTGASLVSSNALTMDSEGRSIGQLVSGGRSGFLDLEDIVLQWHETRTGATQAFDREIIDHFLPWTPDGYWYAGDHVLPFRAALKGGCYYLDKALLSRRHHTDNQGKDITRIANGRAEIDSLLRSEWSNAHFLCTRLFMQRDLEAFAAAHGETKATLAGRTKLAEAIAERQMEWSKSRVSLLNGGYRPLWLPRDEFLARAGSRRERLARRYPRVWRSIRAIKARIVTPRGARFR